MRPAKGPTAAHNLVFDGPLTNIHEAPAMGNGDLGALVQVFQDELRLHLGKNDVWDARHADLTADYTISQAELIRQGRDLGFRLEGANYGGRAAYDTPPAPEDRYRDHGPAWDEDIHPCPKPVGLIRILVPGTSSTRIHTEIDLARAVLTVRYDMEFGWHGERSVEITAWVDREVNAVRVQVRQLHKFGPLRLVVEKVPESLDDSIPMPSVLVMDETRGMVRQTIPGEHGIEPFSWHLAGVFPGKAPGVAAPPVQGHRWRLWQALELQPDSIVTFNVGVTTTREGLKSPHKRAYRLAQLGAGDGYARRLAEHERLWAGFWRRSGISLQDQELEATWYRNLFALNCQLAPHAMAPGLVGNITPWDSAPWHGGYTVNMNIQKMFLSAMPSNHPEWLDAYAGWLTHMEPSFRHLCQVILGFDGLYSSHMLMPFVPPERQTNSNQAGRALGMIGWHGQPLWWRWEFTRDCEYLRQVAYPFFKATACTYWQYLQKFGDASGDLYPSLNLEWPPWTRDFVHNRDPLMDLILWRNTFRYALEAAERLGVDEEWRTRWTWGLAQIRQPTVEAAPDGGYWLRGDKGDAAPTDPAWRTNRERRGYQATLAAWTVFPGELVAGDEADGLAAQLREIMTHNGWHELHPAVIWIHHWWCAIPALRMGLGNAFELARQVILRERFPAGHARTTHWVHLLPDNWRVPEDNYLGVAATTEMLLQSHDGVLRLFPNWPREQWASFHHLPARGGFVVTASWHPTDGLSATIASLAGEPCRLKWPHPTLPTVTLAGKVQPLARTGDTLSFATEPGGRYQLRSPSELGAAPASAKAGAS